VAIDDQDLNQLLAEIELELYEDDPDLVQSFGALWHPSLGGPAERTATPSWFTQQSRRVRFALSIALFVLVAPGVLFGDWAPLEATIALAGATLLIVGAMWLAFSAAMHHEQYSATTLRA
jgi:Protein of unknown function (DUF3040)